MGRLKGSKNKNSADTPTYMSLPANERILVLANLIVDRIIEDQQNGGVIFKCILEGNNGRSHTS